MELYGLGYKILRFLKNEKICWRINISRANLKWNWIQMNFIKFFKLILLWSKQILKILPKLVRIRFAHQLLLNDCKFYLYKIIKHQTIFHPSIELYNPCEVPKHFIIPFLVLFIKPFCRCYLKMTSIHVSSINQTHTKQLMKSHQICSTFSIFIRKFSKQ